MNKDRLKAYMEEYGIHYMELKVTQSHAEQDSILIFMNPLHGVERGFTVRYGNHAVIIVVNPLHGVESNTGAGQPKPATGTESITWS